MRSASERRVRAAAIALVCLTAVSIVLLALNVLTGLGGAMLASLALPAVGELLFVSAAAALIARAVLVRRDRGAWAALATAASLWVVGDLIRQVGYGVDGLRPIPSLADVGYLAFYPFAYVGLVQLVRGRTRSFRPSMWLDGVIGATAAGALGAAVFGSISSETFGGSGATVITNLAYPLGDLVLLALVAGVFASTGWRPGRSWLAIGAGLVLFMAADGGFLFYFARGQHAVLWLGAAWVVSLLTIAAGAWIRDDATVELQLEGWRVLVAPLVLAAVAISLLAAAQLTHLPLLSVALASLALLLVMVRTALTFRENIRLLESRRQAVTDELTGLANRRLLVRRLGQLDGCAGGAGLLLLDLDRFKELNDALGHQVGDDLLALIGPRLRAAVPEAEVLARLGGDEFAVLLVGVDEAGLERSARALLTALDEPFELAGLRLSMAGSVGGALDDGREDGGAALLRRADVAMYEAKRGGGGYARYRADRDGNSRERLALAEDLRDAIGRGELSLRYQPQLRLPGGRPSGVEALVRWEHPRLGMLPPDRFLPVADGAGLMRAVTAWVFQEALAQLRRWDDELDTELTVALNVSTADLHDTRFPAELERMLASAGVAPERVVIEVPEKLLMADIARVVEVLDGLHSLGVALSLDDFGAGYTSFAHLRRLTLDEVKIDRSFVMKITEDAQDAAIVTAAIQLLGSLGLRTVAEGVESAEAWALLERLGADVLQGFHISRPVEASELTAWFRSYPASALPDPGSIVARRR